MYTFSRTRNPQANKGFAIYAPGPYSGASQNIISNNVVNSQDYLANGFLLENTSAFTANNNEGVVTNFPEYESSIGFRASGVGASPAKIYFHSTDGNSGPRDIGYLNFSSSAISTVAQIKARTTTAFDDSGELVFYTAEPTVGAVTERMVIDKMGNIGINKSNPNSKFAVAGLVEYIDNVAALGAGLTIGDFYRTGDLLKVVH
jgi:hypothetical protein